MSAEHLTASVEFHELAQGYRAASQDDAQAAYERMCEYLESRAADQRVVAVAGSVRDEFEAWAIREGHDNLMRMAGDEDQYDDLILRANFKGWLGAAGAMAAPQQVDAVQAVPEGWLIEWTGPDGTKYSELSRHNSVADYRYIDENATGTALVRALASPSPALPTEPSVKQLTAQLHDGQTWTITEQRAFAQVLAAVPNESSEGIISLGDAWKHGQAYGEATVSKATRAVCAEASQKLRTYLAIYTGDKEARRLADELANIAAAQQTDTTAGE